MDKPIVVKDIYLCHKCSGLLSSHAPVNLYPCHCMSGWVRDWQTPVSLEEAKAEQAKIKEQWRAHYIVQGRSAK